VLGSLTQYQHRDNKRSHIQEHHCFVSPFIGPRIAEMLHLTSHKPPIYPEGPRRLSMRNLSKQHHDAGSSQNIPFLNTSLQLGKATISFVMSVGPSVRMQLLGSHWMDFHEILDLSFFRKSAQKSQFSSKSEKNDGYFT